MSDLEQINQVLLEELEKRDEEIAKLQKDINSLLDSPNIGQDSGSSLSDKEAMKLVKKNRNLIVKLNKAKGQIVQLEMNLKAEQEKAAKLKEGKKTATSASTSLAAKHYGAKTNTRASTQRSKDSESDTAASEGEESLEQSLQDQAKKFEKSLLRINELRESNQKLRLEAKKMKNLLQKELGDNVDIDQLLSEGGEGWRGRQQEIFLLKSKVKQYQGQVTLLKKRLQEAAVGASADDAESELDDGASVAASTVDPKQMQTIRQLSDARRQEIADLQDQLKKAEEGREKWKRSTEAAKARCNILEREISSQNMKMSRIIKKTENDDKYISALKTELDKLREKLRESNKKLSNTRTIKPGETLSSTLTTLHNQEVDELQRQVADMDQELAQKEETIQSLKQQLRRATEESSLRMSSPYTSSTSSDEPPKNSADLKITILEMELEKRRDLEQFYQQQLKDYELRQQEAFDDVQSLKHKVKELENALSKTKTKSPNSADTPTHEDEKDMQKLADNLYLVMDENNVLKQTIKSLRATKERELKIYKDLLLKQKNQIDSFAERNPSQGGARVASSASSSTESSPDIEDLQQQNEQLTKQLKEMKNRYTAVSIQLQNAQNQLKNLQ